MENEFRNVFFGALAGLIAYLTGLNWELIIIWFALVCVDIILGVIQASKNGEFKSSIMRQGLQNKIGEFFLLFALVLIQRVAILNNINVPVASVFIGAFCFKEFASILESSIGIGIGIPEIVKGWFKIAHESINKKDDDNV
ncbi:phage holin family protein [Tissierella sp.]|uniref:phage holin family protein n=1 Tax=Tissierella sp. TaxID=41274 RepID=UPI00303697F0